MTAAGEPITKGELVWMEYGLAVDTGQLQEDCHTWWSNMEAEKTWIDFQTHSIEAQADLIE